MIEIYVIPPPSRSVLEWVQHAVGEPRLVEQFDTTSIYTTDRGVSVTVTYGVEDGPFTGVMFAGAHGWSSDAAYARDFVRAVGGVARCYAAGSGEKDEWLQVRPSGERIVPWNEPVLLEN